MYRFAGPAVYAFYALVALGVVAEPLEGNMPESLYTLYAVLTMGVALATPVLFVIATVGGLATAADWRFAAPLWLFSAAVGLFLLTTMVFPDLLLPHEQTVWPVAASLLLVSAAWATVVGYRETR